VKIHPRITSVGESGKKNKKKFHVFAQTHPYERFAQILWLLVRLLDVISYAKFCRNQLRGFDSVRGRSLTIPIELRCRR